MLGIYTLTLFQLQQFCYYRTAHCTKIMLQKNSFAKVVRKPKKVLQEKQKSFMYWAKFETQLIIEWFCIKNKNSIRVNYDA